MRIQWDIFCLALLISTLALYNLICKNRCNCSLSLYWWPHKFPVTIFKINSFLSFHCTIHSSSLDNISCEYFWRDHLFGLTLWTYPCFFELLHAFAFKAFCYLSALYLSSLGTTEHCYVDPCLQSSHDKSFSCSYITFENMPWVVSFPLCRNFCPFSLLPITSFVWYDADRKILTKSEPLTLWSLISMCNISVLFLSLCL